MGQGLSRAAHALKRHREQDLSPPSPRRNSNASSAGPLASKLDIRTRSRFTTKVAPARGFSTRDGVCARKPRQLVAACGPMHVGRGSTCCGSCAALREAHGRGLAIATSSREHHALTAGGESTGHDSRLGLGEGHGRNESRKSRIPEVLARRFTFPRRTASTAMPSALRHLYLGAVLFLITRAQPVRGGSDHDPDYAHLNTRRGGSPSLSQGLRGGSTISSHAAWGKTDLSVHMTFWW